MAAPILNLSFEFSPKIGTRQLPRVDRDHQSNVPGLYIVGDLADAPVIKIALNQGFEVAEGIFRRDFGGQTPKPEPDLLDLVIVGAGPAGIGAALAAKAHGLSYVVLERERPFNTIQNFPKNKHIFSEPRHIPSGPLAFTDASKEDLVKVWEQALEEHSLLIEQPQEVTEIRRVGHRFDVVVAGSGIVRTLAARKVVLAIGRRGAVKKLGCPGEELGKVRYALSDPGSHKKERCLVVGGGDSAVEAALALSEAGAEVTLVHRGDAFSRAKSANRAAVERGIVEGKLRVAYKASVQEITPETVTVLGPSGEETLPNERVFVLIGTELPLAFLKKLGVKMEGELTRDRVAFISFFAVSTYLFYCIKGHRAFWPFGAGQPLEHVADLLKLNLGWRWVDGSFWGTVIYSLLITIFGIQAIRKYRSPLQTKRYLSLIGFQLIFLFGLPELVAPFFMREPWKLYTLSVPWPLSIWSLVHRETAWLITGAVITFVVVPLFVRYHGERFCSWACGCGGLAETLGDRWRHLAPRGTTAKKLEWLGRGVLIAAAITTLLILGHDIFGFLTGPTFTEAKAFAQSWYSVTVDFWFASVLGVAFYPYLGNRVWCRFLCPLRAYMELLARRFGRLKIVANDHCIGCGECTRFCQMGIQVQRFAQLREELANHNSACIQCGICVEVCPMAVLSVVRGPTSAQAAKPRPGAPGAP